MDDKCKFNYRERNMPAHPVDPKVEPIQYFLDNPVTKKVPNIDQFKDWPLQQRAFFLDYD